MGFEGKKVLICGMARSGVAAAQCLYECGAKVTICDNKTEQQLSEALAPLEGMDIRRCLGGEQPDFASYDLVVTSPGIPLTAPVLKNAAAAGVPIIGELEAGAEVSRAPLYAITGTNGKTTTTTLVGEIFKNYGKTAYVVGNIGYPFTACAIHAGPEDVAVAEVSSFQLETITTFHPHVAVMCNITEDHLNRHGTMEEYIRIKERIFEKMDENDFAVLNYDDEIVRGMAARLHCRAAFFSHKAEVQLGTYVENGEMIFVKDGKKKKIIKVDEIYIPGEHNLENALAAAALTLLAGVPAHVVKHTLKTFKGVEHRIETVRTVDGVTYINDSKGTNVDASIKAVRTMKAGTVLLAGGYDKHTDFTPFAREIRESKIHTVVTLGDTAGQIEDALKSVGYDSFVRADTFEDAVNKARALAKPGENVLLSPACASFDMFANYEQRGRVFKDIVNRM